MSNLKNKLGMSSIISVTLVILIGMTLATTTGIIVTDSSLSLLSPALKCSDVKIQEPIQITNAIYNSNTKNVEITLSRKLDALDITTFQLDFVSGPEISQSWSCDLSCGQCVMLSKGETKKYFVPIDDVSSINSINLKAEGCTLSSQALVK